MTSSTIPHPPIVSRDEWLADHNIADFALLRRYPRLCHPASRRNP